MLVHNFLSIGFELNFFFSLVLENENVSFKSSNILRFAWQFDNNRKMFLKLTPTNGYPKYQNINHLSNKQYDILIDLSWVNYDAINEMPYHSTDFGNFFTWLCCDIQVPQNKCEK